MERDRHEAVACEICGSHNDIGKYQLDGKIVIRCRNHQANGIDLDAERIYWERRMSLLDENESNEE